MRIAIFDYRLIASNPAGRCHLVMLRSLAQEHQFTVFSVQFENPAPDRIEWIHVPAPLRPLALLFVTYHLLAPCMYVWHKLRTGDHFDIVQSVESNLSFGELIYAHFCHRSFLRTQPRKVRGLREFLRWLDHALHALVEAMRYPFAGALITPSAGLAGDLKSEFRIPVERVHVIPNPVATVDLQRPPGFDGTQIREQLGVRCGDCLALFVALGHFERKGLPVILKALLAPGLHTLKLLVLGGEADAHTRYRRAAAEMGLGERVRFHGIVADVRPYLWSADVFVLPSAYESFSFATYEAAAAGLPILVPPLHGISDLLRDGINGFSIAPTAVSVASALQRILTMSRSERSAMGECARLSACEFSEDQFVAQWRQLYDSWNTAK